MLSSPHLFRVMTYRINILSVGMRRIVLTGKCLYALLFTGRLSSNFTVIVVMIEFRNSFILNGSYMFARFILEYTATSSAGEVCIVTVHSTCCILSCGKGHIVTKGRILAISGVIALRLSTILVCIPTDFRTGCCLNGYCCDIMANSSDNHLLNGGFVYTGILLKYFLTCFACVVFVVTAIGTGCRNSVGLGHLMSKSSLCFIRRIIAT